jgi:hypothetical protein
LAHSHVGNQQGPFGKSHIQAKADKL